MSEFSKLSRGELPRCREAMPGLPDAAVAALRDSERRLRGVFEHVVDALIMIDERGLIEAVNLAAGTEKVFHLACRFDCRRPVLVHDNVVATHLFRIAQEAVANAVKHSQAREILIRLQETRERLLLAVRDHGIGLTQPAAERKGMGLHIMQYRAGIVGGSLVVQRHPEGGTSVICSLAASSRAPANPRE